MVLRNEYYTTALMLLVFQNMNIEKYTEQVCSPLPHRQNSFPNQSDMAQNKVFGWDIK